MSLTEKSEIRSSVLKMSSLQKKCYPQINVKNKDGNMEVEKGVRFGDVFLQVIFREMLVKAELGMAVPENRR